MKGKIQQVKELRITEQELGKAINKRKNWSAPGIDGISNFWWKTVMQAWMEDQNKVPK